MKAGASGVKIEVKRREKQGITVLKTIGRGVKSKRRRCEKPSKTELKYKKCAAIATV